MAENINIQNLEIEIKTNAEQASKGLDSLALSLQKAKEAGKGFSLKNVGKQISNLIEIINKLDYSNLDRFAEHITNLSQNSEFVTGLTKLADYGVSLKQITKTINQLKDEEGETIAQSSGNVNALSSSFDNLSQNVNKAGKELDKEAKEQSKSNKETKKGIPIINGATKGFTKFFKSLGRIAMYRVIRSMFSAITKSIKESISTFYEWDKVAGNSQFAKAMDSMASSLQTFKNSFGSMVAPIITSFAPAIKQMADRLVDFNNTLAETYAVLRGDTTFAKATKVMKEYGSATKGALLSMDQINVLSSTDSIADAYEIAEVSQEAYEKGQQLMSLYSEIKTFVGQIGEILRGVIAMVNEIVGRLIDNGALETLFRIVNDIFGVITQIFNILTPFNDAVSDLVAVVLKLIEPIVNGVLDVVMELVQAITPILTTIVNLVGNLLGSLQPIFDMVGGLLSIIVDISGIGSALEVICDWLSLISNVLSPIFTLLQPILNIIGELVGEFNKAYQSLSNIHPLINLVKEAFSKLSELMSTAGSKLNEFLNSKGFSNFKTNVTNWASDVSNAISNFSSNLRQAFSWDSIKSNLSGMGEKIKSFFTNIGDYLHNAIASWWNKQFLSDIFGKMEIRWNFIADTQTSQNSSNSSTPMYITQSSFPAYSGRVVMEAVQLGAYGGGGYPTSGELFIAREMGAELVGSIGGRTAVMNNDQIVEAVSLGVANAVASVMGNGNDNFNITLQVDGKQLYTSIKKIEKEQGLTIATRGIL